MESFSTAGISVREKLDYWRAVCSDTYSKIDLIARDHHNFEGTLSRHPGGTLSISKVSSSPGKITRAERHLSASGSRHFHIFLQLEGGGRYLHHGRESLVRPGEYALIDTSSPYVFEFSSFCSAISVGIAESVLASYLPHPDRALGVAMSGTHGLGRVAALMMEELYAQAEAGNPHHLVPAVAKSFLEIVASAYAVRPDVPLAETAVTGSRRVWIKRYIEANLTDPELRPKKVAAAAGISPRYLRLLFSEEEETVSRYILRRRLQECAKRMTDPAWRSLSITDIAYSLGFSDTSHFAQSFREYFGVCPRDYRHHRRPSDAAPA